MRNLLFRGCVITTVGMALALALDAQSRVVDLTDLGNTIAKSIQSSKTDWRYELGSPMKGSENVVIQRWTSPNQIVTIAIVSHKSAEEGAKSMRELARDGRTVEALAGLADEGFSWGRGTVSFRRREVTFHVSTVTTSVTFDLEEAAKNLKKDEKLSKEFAHLVEDAIKDK